MNELFDNSNVIELSKEYEKLYAQAPDLNTKSGFEILLNKDGYSKDLITQAMKMTKDRADKSNKSISIRHQLHQATDTLAYWARHGVHKSADIKRLHYDKRSSVPATKSASVAPVATKDVVGSFGANSNARQLEIKVNHAEPSSTAVKIAQNASHAIGYPEQRLAQIVQVAMSRNAPEAVEYALMKIYQKEQRRESIGDFKAYLMALSNDVDADDARFDVKQMKNARTVSPRLVKLLSNPYVDKYDGFVYLQGLKTGLYHTYKKHEQPKTALAKFASKYRSFMHYADTGYPSAEELAVANTVCNVCMIAKKTYKSYPFAYVDSNMIRRALNESTLERRNHAYHVILQLDPLQTKAIKDITLPKISKGDMKGMKRYLHGLAEQAKDVIEAEHKEAVEAHVADKINAEREKLGLSTSIVTEEVGDYLDQSMTPKQVIAFCIKNAKKEAKHNKERAERNKKLEAQDKQIEKLVKQEKPSFLKAIGKHIRMTDKIKEVSMDNLYSDIEMAVKMHTSKKAMDDRLNKTAHEIIKAFANDEI